MSRKTNQEPEQIKI